MKQLVRILTFPFRVVMNCFIAVAVLVAFVVMQLNSFNSLDE